MLMNNISISDKAANAIIWINELLTTKDKQGVGSLGSDDIGYCCLGIGCKVLNIKIDPMDESSFNLKERVGLHTEDGEGATDLDRVDPLVDLNDIKKYTFLEIGTILKQNPGAYFAAEVAKKINKSLTD